jgi:hypothetical protein
MQVRALHRMLLLTCALDSLDWCTAGTWLINVGSICGDAGVGSVMCWDGIRLVQ